MASPIVDDLYSLVVGTTAPGLGIRRFHLLYVGAERLARSLELDELLAALAIDLEYTVANGARRKLFVDAGVVGWRGRALIILGAPDASAAGTTSLLAALVRAGATYYSERYAVLDARGRVHPFPAAPRPHSDAGNGKDSHRFAAELPGERVGRAPIPVGAIVVTKYAAGARWHPSVISPGQAVLALLERAVAAAARPTFALRVLDAVVAGTRTTLRGDRGEADDIITPLLAAAAGDTVVGRRDGRARHQRAGPTNSNPTPQHRATTRSARPVA
jgi:hypothetical protein